MQNKLTFEIQLNSIQDTDNPTKKEVEFILHDFDMSHNYAFISKETSERTLDTLKDMPIVCKYHPKTDANDDALGSHEMFLDKDRETGREIVAMDTLAIGVFTEPAYIKTVEDNGEEKEVVAGKGVLWASRYPNIVGLLKEWVDDGVPVTSSMEILYDEYKVKDGITEILNYYYEGHCLLNSEDRGVHKKIYPAYDVSKLTKLVAQAVEQENTQKEDEQVEKFKKVFELSHDDVRTKLYGKLDPTLGEDSYSWIADIYDDYFVANIYSYEEGNESDKYFKFDYTKSENDIEINFDSKKEVFLSRNWEEATPPEVQNQLSEKDDKISELEKQVNEITSSKEEIEVKFNDTTEKLTQLNSLVEELTPIKEKYEEEQYQKALSEKKDFYSAKFSALKAKDKFESDEVQDLITLSAKDAEESKNAILQLNSMLVDLVTLTETPNETPAIREVASKRENLLPASDDFDSKYSI
ncbi:MAG: hypothetical protein ACI35O_02460 [Bacillaceae bacterium]